MCRRTLMSWGSSLPHESLWWQRTDLENNDCSCFVACHTMPVNDDSWNNRISQWYYLFSKHFVFQNLFMLKTHYLKVNTSPCSYNSIWHNLLLTLHLESNAFCVCIVYTFMTCLKKWSTIMTNFFILNRYCKNICINKIIKYAEFCHITA